MTDKPKTKMPRSGGVFEIKNGRAVQTQGPGVKPAKPAENAPASKAASQQKKKEG